MESEPRFKVGDKVKVIDLKGFASPIVLGDIGKVDHLYQLDGGGWNLFVIFRKDKKNHYQYGLEEQFGPPENGIERAIKCLK